MTEQPPDNHRRPRRLRRTAVIRDLVRETRVHPSQLVLPLFVIDGQNRREPIEALPGSSRMSLDIVQITKQKSAGFEEKKNVIANFKYEQIKTNFHLFS